jgi:hypothetical protein
MTAARLGIGALDAAVARGIADVDARRIKPLGEVLDR